MKTQMERIAKIGVVVALVIAVSILAALWAINFEPAHPVWEPRPFPRDRPIIGDLEFFYMIKTIISSVNITLVSILLGTYVSLYRKTKSEFVIGLIILAIVLLLYALASNPIIIHMFGFRAFGLGPFAMLPDLFTSVALAVLLYFTFKY